MGVFDGHRQLLEEHHPVAVTGRVGGVRGLTVTVGDFPAPLGGVCRIHTAQRELSARVIGFWGEQTLLMPLTSLHGLCRGDRVELASARQTIGVGEAMLGRVVNGQGRPIDGGGPLQTQAHVPLWPEPICPMQRTGIDQVFATGIRAVDALFTVGAGQRLAVQAPSGVGKSVLLGMLARYSQADVNVIAMVGERGREVRSFIERQLGPDGLGRSVVVVSTGDESPLLRVQAAALATAVAEYFRDQGRNVLLLMDSITRLAGAQRQIGLAAGEPPATRGYPPSVFQVLPELLERAGRTDRGAITAFYTVLTEADEAADPIGETVRSVTDGHLLLSRHLAAGGHYPAIDCLQSISRVMRDIASTSHAQGAQAVREVLHAWGEVEELVNIGAYKAGANRRFDAAIALGGDLQTFLRQATHVAAPLGETLERLECLREQIVRRVAPPGGAADESQGKGRYVPSLRITTEPVAPTARA